MDKEDLITHLTSAEALVSPHITEAFRRVDRQDFTPHELKDYAYYDNALPIDHGQSLSQPFTVAFMFELLAPKKDDVILDLGTGTGWTTAMLAHIVGKRGRVYSVEVIPELLASASAHLQKYDLSNITLKQASSRLGLPEFSPFNKILVSAAAQELPATLVDQLATGGTLVMPVENAIIKVEKILDSQLKVRTYPGFAFVPLRY